ncbi:MAG TPA: class I SAM-dependent methyltransferase [Chitinophagaceae bacterium]|nr:class I SAM-dependent methyltransferase [Chitinophagaceae bacterium]
MQQFWDQRYAENETVYGNEPNKFFRLFIDQHKPGTLLLPAEGEGRNAVYAASRGWQVDAFDFSQVAKEKALDFARGERVVINYELKNIADFKAGKQYDAVGLIFVHLPEVLRKKFHQEVYNSIKPGGFMVLEAFAKEQAQLESGGPRDATLLYDAPSLCNDFPFLHMISCEQKEIFLEEGDYHKGKASVLRMIGQRL